MGNIIAESTQQERAWINGVAAKKVVQVDGVTGGVVSPTNGSQKTQIVDSLGNSITSDDNKLDVMAELIPLFKALLLAIANPSYVDKSANAIRNQVQSGTVTTVTNLTNLGSFSADILERQLNMNAWASNIRNLIT